MKTNDKRKADRMRTFRVALGGIFSALGVAIMYVGSFIEVLDLTVAVMASLFCIVTVIETGKRWAWSVYAVTAVLATLLLPNKFPALVYLLFAGYYPMLKEILEGKIKKKAILLTVKVIIFNLAFAAIIAVSVFVLRLPTETGFMLVALILLGNLTFVLYDIALTRLISFYIVKLRPRLSFLNRK